MGIKGFFPSVAEVTEIAHISNFVGGRFGVDAFGWLHRAALPSAVNLARGLPCDKYLNFFASRLDLLKHFGVEPVLVFDGRAVPMKADTNKERKEKREKAKKEGLDLIESGQFDKGAKSLESAIDIPAEMVLTAIKIARDRKIHCIVAPFEADAQLGFLCLKGYINGIISEDSDMFVYGCRLLVAKLESTGRCEVIRLRDVLLSKHFLGMNQEQLVLACILSGCDYSNSLPGVGIKKATKLVLQYKDLDSVLSAVRNLCAEAGVCFEDYEERVHKAFYCFRHHLIYDPATREIIPFNPLGEGNRLEKDIIGTPLDKETAIKVCELQLLHPHTLEVYPESSTFSSSSSSSAVEILDDDSSSSSSFSSSNNNNNNSNNNTNTTNKMTSKQKFTLYNKSLELYWERVRGSNQQPITNFFSSSNNNNNNNTTGDNNMMMRRNSSSTSSASSGSASASSSSSAGTLTTTSAASSTVNVTNNRFNKNASCNNGGFIGRARDKSPVAMQSRRGMHTVKSKYFITPRSNKDNMETLATVTKLSSSSSNYNQQQQENENSTASNNNNNNNNSSSTSFSNSLRKLSSPNLSSPTTTANQYPVPWYATTSNQNNNNNSGWRSAASSRKNNNNNNNQEGKVNSSSSQNQNNNNNSQHQQQQQQQEAQRLFSQLSYAKGSPKKVRRTRVASGGGDDNDNNNDNDDEDYDDNETQDSQQQEEEEEEREGEGEGDDDDENEGEQNQNQNNNHSNNNMKKSNDDNNKKKVSSNLNDILTQLQHQGFANNGQDRFADNDSEEEEDQDEEDESETDQEEQQQQGGKYQKQNQNFTSYAYSSSSSSSGTVSAVSAAATSAAASSSSAMTLSGGLRKPGLRHNNIIVNVHNNNNNNNNKNGVINNNNKVNNNNNSTSTFTFSSNNNYDDAATTTTGPTTKDTLSKFLDPRLSNRTRSARVSGTTSTTTAAPPSSSSISTSNNNNNNNDDEDEDEDDEQEEQQKRSPPQNQQSSSSSAASFTNLLGRLKMQ